MVTCGDVDLDNNTMDIHALRTIVSGDYITLGAFRSLMRSSLTLATNGYLDPKTDVMAASDVVVRQVTVLHMDAAARLLDFEQIPQRCDFVCMCSHVRMTYNHKPVTPITSYTCFGRGVTLIQKEATTKTWDWRQSSHYDSCTLWPSSQITRVNTLGVQLENRRCSEYTFLYMVRGDGPVISHSCTT